MRILTIIALTVMCAGLFAADGKKSVDGMAFVLTDGVWIQQGVDTANVNAVTAVVHQDKRWQSWHARGSENLRQILALGPNVVFQSPSRDGGNRVFSVFESKQLLNTSVSTSANTTSALLGKAAVAASTATRGTEGGDASPSMP